MYIKKADLPAAGIIQNQENLTKEQVDAMGVDFIKNVGRVLRKKFPDAPMNEALKYLFGKCLKIERAEEEERQKTKKILQEKEAAFSKNIGLLELYNFMYSERQRTQGPTNPALAAQASREDWNYTT